MRMRCCGSCGWRSRWCRCPPRAPKSPSRRPSGEDLRWIDPWDQSRDYRTLRAGEGFRTSLFGFDVAEEARDRRSTSALDLGAAAYFNGPDEAQFIPFASLYFWRRPDERRFLRATVGGIYNDVVAARSFGDSPFEAVFAFENNTILFDDNSQWVDGERNEAEELRKMWVRGGVGVGYRRQLVPGWTPLVFADGVHPQRPDNMFSIYLLAEPKYLYFSERNDASPSFVLPQDTFELEGRLAMRWDSLERNMMDLAHRGFAVGFDGTYGWRSNWEDWGIDGVHRADRGRHPKLLQGYADRRHGHSGRQRAPPPDLLPARGTGMASRPLLAAARGRRAEGQRVHVARAPDAPGRRDQRVHAR